MNVKFLVPYFPNLSRQLKVAHIHSTPEKFIERSVVQTLKFGSLLYLLYVMLITKQFSDNITTMLILLFIGLVLILGLGFLFAMQQPIIKAKRRANDIEREVLFAGRFLLIKLHSGVPLINALVEAADSYGVASKYMSEIVKDIELGTSLEDAIEKAMTYTPSDSFRKILFQIHNALRLGVDVTRSLEAALEEITQEQLVSIERYGKKLGSVTLFYMLAGIVFPSLGMTITTVLISFTSFQPNMLLFGIIVFFLGVLNFMFVTVFKSIRPTVNI